MSILSLSDISCADLLPHRARMLLVDEIMAIQETFAVTAATVDASWPLFGSGGVAPLVLIELAAQTAGVCNSWNDLYGKEGGLANKGWLVGIKRADFFLETIPSGSRIITRSENTHTYDMLREIESTQKINNRVIGKVTLQLIKAEEDD